MQDSIEDAIAAESEFHRCNSENHRLVNKTLVRIGQKYKEKFKFLNSPFIQEKQFTKLSAKTRFSLISSTAQIPALTADFQA